MGATNPFIDQDSFRWKLDIVGLNVDSDWAEDINVQLGNGTAIAYDANFRLRFLLQNTGDKVETDGYNLEYQVGSGGWVSVTAASDFVRAFTTLEYTDGDSATQLLGGGTYDEGYGDTDGTITSFTLGFPEESENEFCIQFRGVDFSGSETLELRMAFDSGADLDAYTKTISMTMPTPPSPELVQANFRVRNGDTVGLNVNSDWAGILNANVTIDCHHRFRIRFELEEADVLPFSGQLKLRAKKNAGTFIDIPYYNGDDPNIATDTPMVWITDGDQYTDGTVTTNILSGSAKTFTAGEGQNDNLTGTISLDNQHTELEFVIIIPTFYEGRGQNVDTDTFQFRLYGSSGGALTTYTNTPTITLNVPAYHIGGTHTESSGKLGPFADTNNNIYYILSDEELIELVMMAKSTDNGQTWVQQDTGNEPSQVDLESVDIQQIGDTLHIGHNIGNYLYYHTFRMSDHATTPDTWGTTGELIVGPLSSSGNASGIAVMPPGGTYGGDIYAFYGTAAATFNALYYKRKNGTWGSQQTLEAEGSINWLLGQVIIGEGTDPLTHIVYNDRTNGVSYHRSLAADGTLSGREVISSDIGTTLIDRDPFVNLVYYDDDGVEVIMIVYKRQTDDKFYSKTVRDDASPGSEQAASDNAVLSSSSGVDSWQPVGTIAADGKVVYLLYSDVTDNDIYLDENTDEGGWGTDTEEADAVACIQIRGNIITHGGGKVFAYVWEDGTAAGTVWEGGAYTGYQKYGEFSLEATTPASDSQPAYLAGSASASDSQPAFIAGSLDASSQQDAFVEGGLAASDSKGAYIEGQDTASDSQGVYLTGSLDAVDSKSAYIESVAQASDSKSAYMDGDRGVGHVSGLSPAGVSMAIRPPFAAKISGTPSSDNQTAYIAGIDTTSDNQSAYIAGGVLDSDSQSAFIQGQDTTSNSQSAYIAGGVLDSDRQSAFIQGQDTISDSQSAYIAGGLLASDSQSAFVQGQQLASSSQQAFIAGSLAASDSQQAYVQGIVGAVDSQEAFIQGYGTAVDSQSAYVLGSAESSDRQSGYIAGWLASIASKQAYLAGSELASASKQAFIAGSLDTVDSQQAYIEGSIDVVDSQSAYVSGSLDDSSSQDAYIAGGVEDSDSQGAYIFGIASTSDSSSAYIDGRKWPLPVTEDWTGADEEEWRRSHWASLNS